MTNPDYPAFSDKPDGLTKREYFAAQFMAIERPDSEIEFHIRCSKNLNPHNDPSKPPMLNHRGARALMAVLDADAMIEALNEKTK